MQISPVLLVLPRSECILTPTCYRLINVYFKFDMLRIPVIYLGNFCQITAANRYGVI